MNPNLRSKYIDKIGIKLLTLLLFISLAFRTSPVSFMNPGFPILSNGDWRPLYSVTPIWHEYPKRFLSDDNHSEVAYMSDFYLKDNIHSGLQTVIRYSESTYALLALQSKYEEHMSDPNPFHTVVNHIPGLNFVSGADKYYLWCDQISLGNDMVFDAEKIDNCYYRAVYGRYYSELRFFARGFDRRFSVEFFNDVLNRADKKLLRARQ